MYRNVSQRLLIVLAGVAATLITSCGDRDVAQPEPALTSAAVLQPGAAGVGVTTREFEDFSRPTMANGEIPSSPSRLLVTEIWYPTAPGSSASAEDNRDAPFWRDGRRHPLIIYSHGFMDTRAGGMYLAEHLASYGYVVAAPEFPLTNLNTPDGPNLLDLPNQPGDVRFVIDQMLALDADAASPFFGTIDVNRIGASGLSLGGTTTLLAAFHPTLRDPRIRAAAPLAPGACLFGRAFYDGRHVPLLIVHGSIDAILPYQQNAVFGFAQASAPKQLVSLAGGSHTGFTEAATVLFGRLRNADDVGCTALMGALSHGESDASLVDPLGGSAAGIIDGDCPQPCTDPLPRPRAMAPQRQHDLTLMSVLTFFDASLRDSHSARRFLEVTLASENPEVTSQIQH